MHWLRFNIRFIVPAFICFALPVYLKSSNPHATLKETGQIIEQRTAEQITRAFIEADLVESRIKSGLPWPDTEFIFLYRTADTLITWNKSVYAIPPFNTNSGSVAWVQSQSLKALYITKVISDTTILNAIIPLQQTFKIHGRSGEPELNKTVFRSVSTQVFPPDEPGRINVFWKGVPVFSVAPPVLKESRLSDFISIIFLLAGTVLLFKVRINGRKAFTVLLISAGIVLIRLWMVYFKLPGTSGDSLLFDPSIFASSGLNDSPGNLLLNVFALLLISSLISGLKTPFFQKRRWNAASVFMMSLTVLLVSFGAILLPVLILESIYHHSVLTPDVTQSFVFGSPRIALILSVIAAGASAFLMLRKTIPVLVRIYFLYPVHSVISLLTLISGLLLWQNLTGKNHLPALYTLLLLIILPVLKRYSFIRSIKFLKDNLGFNYQIIIGISFLCAFAIQELDKERNFKQLRRISTSMLNTRDEFSEYLLRLAIQDIAADPALRIINDDPLSEKQKIYERLRKKFPSGYFRGEPPQFYYLDVNNQPKPGTSLGLDELLPGFRKIEDLAVGTLWHDSVQSLSPVSRRYMAIAELGFLRKSKVVMIVSDSYFPDQALPVRQSMLTGQFRQPFNWNRQFSAAVYSNGNLIKSTGDFDYQSAGFERLTAELGDIYSETEAGTYLHLFSATPFDSVLILSVPSFTGTRFVTNFSVLLFVALMIMAAVWLLNLFRNYVNGNALSYSDRIRLYLIGVFSVPALIIVFFVITTVDRSSGEARANQIKIAATGLARDVAAWLNAGTDDDIIAAGLQQAGSGVSYILYDPAGKRKIVADPQIRESNVIPLLAGNDALMAASINRSAFFSDETAGKLFYKTAWVPVISQPGGFVSGMLGAHVFDFYLESDEQRIRLITAIIFVLVPVFVLFLILSHVMANRLTRPIVAVSRALQKTTLNTLPAVGQDEMGLMVTEYNRMVENLEKSKVELVRSQREQAWREMARQVAHEIRNPLTPIRLTIQRLLNRTSALGSEATETNRALKSVLMQTEILSSIADSFSALSGLPALKPETVDLVAAAREDIALFINPDAGSISAESPANAVYIKFDRKFLSRILSNLILNARQSSDNPVDIEITIQESQSGPVLVIRDNGGGIDESLREKIFTPNFTTKKTGTGLGLWLCRQGMEQVGGSIQFESEPGKGTVFTLRWPSFSA